MSLKKFLVIPLIIASLAFILQIIDQLLSPVMLMQPNPNLGFCWIALIAWAVYFVAGSDIKGGIKALLGFIVGTVVAILVMSLAGVLFDTLQFFALPVAVGLVVFCSLFLEKTTWFDFIPAVIIGAGVYIALMCYVSDVLFADATVVQKVNAAITEIVYCALGLFVGYVTVTLRTAYEKRVTK